MSARRKEQFSRRGGRSMPIALTRRTSLKLAAAALGAPLLPVLARFEAVDLR